MPFPTTPVLDTFNRASLGASWTAVVNTCSIESSVRLKGDTSGDNIVIYNALSVTYQFEVFADVVTTSMQCLGMADGSYNGYQVFSDGTNMRLSKLVGGTPGAALVTVAQAVVNGDGIGLRRIGDVLQMQYRSGTGGFIPVGSPLTDSTYNNGGNLYANCSGTTTRIDNFGGGSFVTLGEYPFPWQRHASRSLLRR
jgi:hypothetical protein